MSVDILDAALPRTDTGVAGPPDSCSTRDGDPDLGEGLDRIFRAHAPRLLRFFSRRAARREDAADLLQDAFVRLIRLANARELPVNPEAYLQRIAVNLLRDHARRAASGTEGRHAALDEEQLADAGPDPYQQLEGRQMLARYETALHGLKPKTREIFLRHRLDGLTYAQIANDLNQSVSCVEKHMMKAIAHLDRVLGRL